MTIYSKFVPTYLYIKQHSVTGMLYFGKTINDPETYQGSGKYWKRHIKNHGKEYVITLWCSLFTDKEELVAFAIQFSKSIGIVESNQWANLIDENGLDGCTPGTKHSNETKAKISAANKIITQSERQRRISAATGVHRSQETKLKMSQSRLNIMTDALRSKIGYASKIRAEKFILSKCPHCGKEGSGPIMQRWHFDKCKNQTKSMMMLQ